jgi:hypothetical protein
VLCAAAPAAELAADSAASAVYNDGWQNGDDGGVGFEPWIWSTTSGDNTKNGFLYQSSTFNNANTGSYDDNGEFDIDTGGRAWGLYANDGQTASAVRPFSQAMSPTQVFRVEMDNGGIKNGGVVGFGLQNSSGVNLFEVFFVGGQSNYTIKDAGGERSSDLGFTRFGLLTEFTLTSPTTYNVKLSVQGGSTRESSGSLLTGTSISQFRMFNFDANPVDGNPNNDNDFNFYINNITVTAIPEPLAGLGGLAMLGLLVTRRR